MCPKCNLAGTRVVAAMQKAELRERLAAQKEEGLSSVVNAEKKKRFKLEAEITSRLSKLGGYKLEGKDACLVSDGVVA